MKKIFLIPIGIIILLLTINILIINGKCNWESAKKEAITYTDLTDSEIHFINLRHGFNLDWWQTPTVKDYILSNFKKYNRSEIISVYSINDIYYLAGNSLTSESGKVILITDNRKVLIDSLETLTADDANKANGY